MNRFHFPLFLLFAEYAQGNCEEWKKKGHEVVATWLNELHETEKEHEQEEESEQQQQEEQAPEIK